MTRVVTREPGLGKHTLALRLYLKQINHISGVYVMVKAGANQELELISHQEVLSITGFRAPNHSPGGASDWIGYRGNHPIKPQRV